jgi:hypothetical protein
MSEATQAAQTPRNMRGATGRMNWLVPLASVAMSFVTFVGVSSPPAGAAFRLRILPTITRVTASPSTVQDGRPASITFTATVSILSVYLTPTGIVTFNEYSPNGALFAGPYVAPLHPCLILVSSCTATFSGTTGNLNLESPPGVWTVVATYSGDALARPSTGSVTYTVLGPP